MEKKTEEFPYRRCGKILRSALHVESNLDSLIFNYFCYPQHDKGFLFLDSILNRTNFERKIEILKQICEKEEVELEAEIIDTKSFQRLRRIRQLGATHLIYPGAMHTRFDHSLGTLHMAQKIVDTVNNNRDSYISIDAYPHLLIRLCALLHDVVCITFGHTLEDEGNLFPAQWKDKNRVETFLGEGSEIGQIIKSRAGSECLRDVKRVLEAQEEEEIKKLDYPYVADIVSNTLCADLLDYIKRDVYFTGISC